MPLTMKDIARMVGVSESTVSRAINGQPGVGKKTKEQILALVEEYQFKPNTLAQGLATKKTKILGLILPDITDLSFTEIVCSVEEEANQSGYHLILANTGGRRDKEINYLTFFQQNRVDGIIFLGSSLAEEEILKLGLNNYPLVIINKLMEELALPTLLIDHQKAAELAVGHLIRKKHEKIGMVIGSLDELSNIQLYDGYQAALLQNNLVIQQNLVIEVENSRNGGYSGFLKLLERESLPSAVFAASDHLAVGVIEAIKTGGYLIPEDIAVVGYGDNLITDIIYPSLTTLKLPLQELGKKAVEKLIKAIKKEELIKKEEVIKKEETIKEDEDELFQVLIPKLLIRQSA